ncbi:MAG: hypothetical protein Q8P41_20860 [Pseudomonadota bacterium]|nr:hypothetical protein [Pseudomonadota bacterium]
MLLLVMLGCVPSSNCEIVTTEVGDDAPLAELGFTMGELYASLVGTRAVPMRRSDGEIVAAELTITRGEDPALFNDTTLTSQGGNGALYVLPPGDVFHMCFDNVEAPIDVTLTADEGAVAVAGTTTAGRSDDEFDSVGSVFFALAVPIDDATLTPPPRDDAREARLEIIVLDGHLETVVVEWESGVNGASLVFPPVSPAE